MGRRPHAQRRPPRAFSGNVTELDCRRARIGPWTATSRGGFIRVTARRSGDRMRPHLPHRLYDGARRRPVPSGSGCGHGSVPEDGRRYDTSILDQGAAGGGGRSWPASRPPVAPAGRDGPCVALREPVRRTECLRRRTSLRVCPTAGGRAPTSTWRWAAARTRCSTSMKAIEDGDRPGRRRHRTSTAIRISRSPSPGSWDSPRCTDAMDAGAFAVLEAELRARLRSTIDRIADRVEALPGSVRRAPNEEVDIPGIPVAQPLRRLRSRCSRWSARVLREPRFAAAGYHARSDQAHAS